MTHTNTQTHTHTVMVFSNTCAIGNIFVILGRKCTGVVGPKISEESLANVTHPVNGQLQHSELLFSKGIFHGNTKVVHIFIRQCGALESTQSQDSNGIRS